MKKFFYDILRDKGSVKFSITKSLALGTFIFFIIYLIIYTFVFKEEVDHALIIELIAFIGALVGLKNKWGRNEKTETTNSKITLDNKDDVMSKDEEGVF